MSNENTNTNPTAPATIGKPLTIPRASAPLTPEQLAALANAVAQLRQMCDQQILPPGGEQQCRLLANRIASTMLAHAESFIDGLDRSRNQLDPLLGALTPHIARVVAHMTADKAPDAVEPEAEALVPGNVVFLDGVPPPPAGPVTGNPNS